LWTLCLSESRTSERACDLTRTQRARKDFSRRRTRRKKKAKKIQRSCAYTSMVFTSEHATHCSISHRATTSSHCHFTHSSCHPTHRALVAAAAHHRHFTHILPPPHSPLTVHPINTSIVSHHHLMHSPPPTAHPSPRLKSTRASNYLACELCSDMMKPHE
jgi:hypothetical protein